METFDPHGVYLFFFDQYADESQIGFVFTITDPNEDEVKLALSPDGEDGLRTPMAVLGKYELLFVKFPHPLKKVSLVVILGGMRTISLENTVLQRER